MNTEKEILEQKILETKSVRISGAALEVAKEVKRVLGFPIARFIEEAICEKVERLPKKTKEKLGLIEKQSP